MGRDTGKLNQTFVYLRHSRYEVVLEFQNLHEDIFLRLVLSHTIAISHM